MVDAERKRKVLLVGSSGGHLAQLLSLRPWWEPLDRLWVTFPTQDSQSLLADEATVWAHHPTTRNARNCIRNLLLGWKVLRRYRPDVVVSSGAGVAFPLFFAARILGISTAYVEVFDRIDVPTLTGKLCYPFSDIFMLQWPEQQRFYPRGTLVGPLL